MTAITSCKRCGAPLGADEAQKPLQGMCTRCLFELGLEEGSHVVITGTGEAPAPPPTPEELQPLFPQFELIELLGQGGMGVVYRARQKGLGREVALKVLPAKAGRNPAFAERFAREAKALASLSHPNITSVFDFGKAGEHFFLVMELVDGLNLRQLVRAQRVAPKQALQIVEQICDALQYAHDEGVVHRDIKPENILLDRKGRLKITDFGLAKLLDRAGAPPSPLSIGLTETHQVMGTPHYMAPEQIERPSSVDHRADIYSLGVVFYELLTGELPIGRFASPSGKVQVDVRLDAVVLRALEKEPELRYQSAGAVKTDVHDIAEPGSGERAVRAAPGAGPAPAATAVPRKAEKSWLGVFAAVTLGLLAVPAIIVAAAFGLAFLPGGKTEEMPTRVEVAKPPAPPDPQLARLEGVPLFEMIGGSGTSLSLPFRTVFSTEPEVAQAMNSILSNARRAYAAEEEAHTQRLALEPGAARVTLEPFPVEAAAVAEGVLLQAHALLPAKAYDYLVAREALQRELFPPAAERVVHDLRRTPKGFEWSTSVGGGPATPERGDALPPALAAYWEKLYRPLLPSALAALERFLAEVRALDEGGGAIQLSTVQTSIGGFGPSVARLRVESRATFKGADLAASSLLFEQVCDRLRAVPGFTVQEVAIEIDRQGAWLSAPLKVELETDLVQAPRPLSPLPNDAPRPETGIVALINQAASTTGITLDKVDPTANSEAVSCLVSQSSRSARPLDEELAWLRSLETLWKHGAVLDVTLVPEGSPEKEGTWYASSFRLYVPQRL